MTSRGHVDQKGAVDLATHGGELGIERHSLGGVAREAVEDEALLGVIGSKALLDKVDHELVGNELASVHVLLSLNTKLGATLDGSTQQVARGNVSDAKLGDELLCDGALTGTRSSEQYEVHEQSSSSLFKESIVIIHLDLAFELIDRVEHDADHDEDGRATKCLDQMVTREGEDDRRHDGDERQKRQRWEA